MTTVNRQIRLAARPVGFPKVSDFQLVYSPQESPSPGRVLVRSGYLSLDPYMRSRMDAAETYARPIAIGEVMVGRAAAHVVESGDPRFRVGEAVTGMLGWQEYAAVAGDELTKIDPGIAPISTALGVLGMPGLTAYFGLLDVCEPQAGETVVVSGAAGAVGMIAGQIAKIRGCRVVGVAGSDAKTAWLLEELGLDAAINHRSDGDFDAELERHCPDGVDVYFDNVGGAITDAVVGRINDGARISLCGQSSQYNLEQPEPGPRWLSRLIVKRAKMQGFLVSAYADRFGEGLRQLALWLRQGRIKYREDVAQGIESAPRAFIAMLRGLNQGKQLVQLSGASPGPNAPRPLAGSSRSGTQKGRPGP
jgi:NADPH:quinone reductase